MIKAILVSVPQFIFCGITGIIFLVPVLAVVLSAAVWKGYFHVPVKRTLAVIWSIIALLPVGVVGLIWNFGAEYQKMRLQVMFRPSSYVMEEGYQYHTIRKLIAGSKLVGAADSLKELSGQTVPSTSLALTYGNRMRGGFTCTCDLVYTDEYRYYPTGICVLPVYYIWRNRCDIYRYITWDYVKHLSLPERFDSQNAGEDISEKKMPGVKSWYFFRNILA